MSESNAPLMPLSEPPWLNGAPSPYYDDSHRKLQAACREFIGHNLNRHALDWETAEEVPADLYRTFVEGGFVLPSLPAPLPVEWLHRVGITHMPGGIPVEDWTSVHGMIYADEVSMPGGGSCLGRHRAQLTGRAISTDEPRWSCRPLWCHHHRHGLWSPAPPTLREPSAAG